MNCKTVIFSGIALLGVVLFANDDITLEKFPDADAVSVKSVREVTYNTDGTYVDHGEEWIKVLTEKGRREESELGLHYSARYGTAKIISVSIIGTNGVERAVDVSGTMNETTDNSSMDENIYDPLDRRITCTVPGLQIGETLRYSFEREIKNPRFGNQWSTSSVLEWQCPIIDQTFRVIAPKEHPIKTAIIRNQLGNVNENVEEREDGRIVYTWHAENTPQAFSEPDTPPFYMLVQNLQVSTAENWEELSKWYWDLCLPHIEKTNAAISNKVVEVLSASQSGDPRERIRSLYKWVAQEIRYMGLTMEDTSPGYAPHDVDITFDNRYGVCRDKAALLVSMLRLAGFEAFPVLIQAGAKRDPEVPSPFFNHAIVAVSNPAYNPDSSLDDQTDGKYILMDPTDESSRDLMPAYLCNCSYMVARPEGETLRTSPVVPAEDNAFVVDSYGTLESDGVIMLKQTMTFNGVNDNSFRQALLRRRPESRRKVFESILRARFPGAELLRCDILPADLRDTNEPLVVKLISRLPETVLRGETRDELNPPLISQALGAATWLLSGKTSLESRKYPFVINSTASSVETLRIDLGGILGEPLSLPEDRFVEGKYEYARTFRVEDGVLVVNRKAAINAVEFSPDEYGRLREALKQIESAERERPVFGKEFLAEANVRFRLYKQETGFTGDDSWVTTNTIIKEILTYDGKKSSSELSFVFNPTWEDIDVISAIVSNANGKVSYLSALEKNIMDCSWASSAPRYPASKQLIVNLPSVEIGSVISYVVVTSAKDAPAPFYGKWNFDVYEPVDEYVVRVGDITRTVYSPKVIKAEAMSAPGEFWRDFWIVSSNSFPGIAAKLRLAADVKPVKSEHKDIKSIRDWMVSHVRISGPSLYEIPIEKQITDPEVVLKEHYASNLDFIRTMCALMRGAGYEADVVFSSANGGIEPQLKQFDMTQFPNVRAFSIPLCRVREKKGGMLFGLLPFGRETTTYFIGTENEFTPIGASSYAGSNYFDPQTELFEVVTSVSDEYYSYSCRETKLNVSENGAVDFDIDSKLWGPGVGTFRKQYEEMLPEDRSRHHQELLGEISQAAKATSELVTDTKSYPARRAFACNVPSFAIVEGDMITITLPDFYEPLFPLTGVVRDTPICLNTIDGERVTYSVTFPEGYTEIEHLPNNFAFRSTLDVYQIWYQSNVYTRYDEAGRLVVDVVRERAPRIQTVLAPEYFGMIKDWSRIGSSRANRAIVVRRKK